jgi:dimethylhistidine N-methyltransferase
MLETALTAKNVVFKKQQPQQSNNRDEIMRGLLNPKKSISPKYFYDTLGSELFEKITELPEYYPTRSERSILTDNAETIATYCGQQCVLVEPGSGSSEKVRLLLDAVHPSAYVPMDIAEEFLQRSANKLAEEFPWLNVHALCSDFTDDAYFDADLPEGKRIVFYPGSTLGNMNPEQAGAFLIGLKSWLGLKGGVLIGIDLHKEESVLHAAYNDSQGITAEFNLNSLNAINRIMPANFDLENFEHKAFYNQELQRIEMHLVSKLDHIVRVANKSIAFVKDETIHTENSYKYTQSSFQALAVKAGFTIRKTWFDEDNLFAVHYLELDK